MIQILNASQFTKAAERARKERMLVSRTAPREFSVLNRKKGNRYSVTFQTINQKFFGSCNCAAGMPMHRTRTPLVCKHLYAAYIVLRALSGKVQSH